MASPSEYLQRNNLPPWAPSDFLFEKVAFPVLYSGIPFLPIGVLPLLGLQLALSLIECIVGIALTLIGLSITSILRSSTPEWIQKHTWVCFSFGLSSLAHCLLFGFFPEIDSSISFEERRKKFILFNALITCMIATFTQLIVGRRVDTWCSREETAIDSRTAAIIKEAYTALYPEIFDQDFSCFCVQYLDLMFTLARKEKAESLIVIDVFDQNLVPPTIEHYILLGVPPNTPINEIKKAYHKLVRLYHPDKNLGQENSAMFLQISNAYQVIVNWVNSANQKTVSQ